MPWLTQLADVARKSGYPVTEVSGWKTRGHGPQTYVRGIVAHHTAGRDDMDVVRDGRPGLDGPLSHFWLRHDGHIFVIAAGRCWHNAPSTSINHSNSYSLGIEAENDGHEPWPQVQLDAYHALCAALCREFGLAASAVKGHREVNLQKVDPHSITMSQFRSRVAALIKNPGTPTTQEEEDVPEVISVGAGEDQEVKAASDTAKGELVARWHTEYVDDVPGHSADGVAIMAKAESWAICDAIVKLRGLQPGDEVDIVWSRYDRDGNTWQDDAWSLTAHADQHGRIEESVGGQFGLGLKNQLRMRIINPNKYAPTFEKVTMAKVSLFKRS